VKFQRVDLVLAVGAGLNRPGGAYFLAGAGQRVGAQALADVDRGQAGERDSLRVPDDEVSVAVTVGVDALDVDDRADRFAAGGVAGRAVRGRRRSRPDGESQEDAQQVGDHIR
jgi:hypothetical protein